MAQQKPLLVTSGLTGSVYVVTHYTRDASGNIVASRKYDVTEQFDRLAEERASHV